jgi:hypothetical protein
MNAIHRTYVRRETAISAVINSAIGAAFFVVLFGGQMMVNLWGADGLVVDCLPQGFMVGLFSVVPASLMLRMRLGKGLIQTSAETRSSLPRSFIGRTLLLSILSMLGLILVASALAWLSGQMAISFGLGLAMKMLGSALISVIITPVALRAMLSAR